jgi:hypothetical protein
MKRYFLLGLLAVHSCLAAQFTEFSLGFNTYAMGINNNGVVVGYVQTGQGEIETGFIRQADGSSTSGFVFSSGLRTRFHDINDSGGIVGSYIPMACCTNGLTYNGGTYASFNHGVSEFSWTGVNNQGDRVGYYRNFGGPMGGLIQLAGTGGSLYSLPGAQQTYIGGINDLGQMAGMYQDTGGIWNIFIRNADGSIQSIVTPWANATGLVVSGINDAGYISGYYNSGGSTLGFVYANGNWINLNYAGASRTRVGGINNNNQVVGHHNATPFGTFNGFIATLAPPTGGTQPADIPEPSTYVLMSTSFALLACMRRFRAARRD